MGCRCACKHSKYLDLLTFGIGSETPAARNCAAQASLIRIENILKITKQSV